MKRPLGNDRVTTLLLLVMLSFVLSMSGVLSRIDQVLYDIGQQKSTRTPSQDVVIVTIDEQSLATLGRWPWSRRLHAQLLDNISADGARVIGFDVMFSEPQRDDPEADQELAKAVARAGNLVLPVVIEKTRSNGQLVETLPLENLVAHAAALGRVHAELDSDTIARSVMLWEGLMQPAWPHFAQAMLATAGQWPQGMQDRAPSVEASALGKLVKRDQRYINFSTSHTQLATVSYDQVIRGEFSPGTFTNKLVLIGATASGMADSLPTPISGFRQPMPGVEFLANTLISMRDRTLISTAPTWVSTALACMVCALPMLWMPFTRARNALLINITFAALVLGASIALPVVFYVWVPMAAGVASILSAYPLWAWRKLESATQFLDAELARLEQELSPASHLTAVTSEHLRPSSADPFQMRIDQVRAATAKLQRLEQDQRETLAFVSHDIRVPLASAAAHIKTELSDQHPAHHQLMRALAWTEDFLQTSRVQMLQSQAFADIDVIGLLQEVADEIYPLAEAQHLQLQLDLPHEPMWVHGHFETIFRAVANLLSNALKYSPPNGVLRLSATPKGQRISIGVTNQGAGIAEKDAEKLFKRFSRLESASARNHSGVGLGLYFVETAIQKHGGNVHFSSRSGETTFFIELPLAP